MAVQSDGEIGKGKGKMNEYLENLHLNLTQPRRMAPTTIASGMSTASIFLTWLGDRIPPSDKDLRLFFQAREEQGISARSRGTEFWQLKKLFEANHWPWPFTKRDRPVAEEEPFQPAFPPDEVLQLIAAREKYSPQENFYLALSATYGPRREDIGRVGARHIHDNIIIIRTAKKGKMRQHLIPEEIQPIMSSWRARERGRGAITYAFRRIMEKSGLGRRPGWGFHSMRRTVQTMLEINLAKNNYPPAYAGQWMGWAKTTIGARYSQTPMAGVYAHPEILSDDPYWLDRLVFSVHPFLMAYTL